jgi:hypothetical protein
VSTASQLGNDAPEGSVLVNGGLDHRGMDVKVLVNDCGSSLVTARFDAED